MSDMTVENLEYRVFRNEANGINPYKPGVLFMGHGQTE